MAVEMRRPKYTSYSALSCWEKDREEFYLRYLAPSRPPRSPQGQPAAAGSGFDARVKCSLHAELFGEGADPEYHYPSLFDKQVEEQHREWAKPETEYIFEAYKQSGAYDRLIGLCQDAVEPCRFEFSLLEEIGGVPVLAKPDGHVRHKSGLNIVHDFKLNGYCSNSALSPAKGYWLCSDGYEAKKQSRSHNMRHPLCDELVVNGVSISANYMEDFSMTWADQLTMYGWALGEGIGDEDVVVCIDQIVAKPLKVGRPLLRVATFRCRVRDSYQKCLLKRLQDQWEVTQSDHIFRDLSYVESEEKCERLNNAAVHLDDDFFNEVVRAPYRG